MTGHDVYRVVLAFLEDNGWERVAEGDGWWHKPGHAATEGMLGYCLDEELLSQGIDTREQPE